ncbi:MAG: right-handed parallel beta-helix repeat-containing protein [Candidatus Thermoplasmatota archaeon]
MSNLPALAPHAPIDIESDADFTPENGVTGGTGAPDDPYVIEGWDIQGAGQVTAVYIKGTTAHFVVRNVYVHDSYSGVSLVGAVNARIENVVASGNDLFGIGLFDVTGALVQGCSALDSPIGIEIVHGSGNTIVGCDAHGNTGTDLIIDGSPHNNLRANAIGATFKVNPQDGPEPLAGYEQDIDPSNTIGGKPIVYLVGTDGALVDGATMNVGLVTLVHARNVTLLNLDLTQQVLLADVTDSTISKCEVSSPANGNILDASNAGILLIGSSRNAITDCDLHDNAYGLLMLDGSNDNVVTRLIAHNNTGSINSYGVVVDASSGNRIEDCRLADNMVGGLRLVSSNQNVIDGCTAWATPGNEDGGTYGFVVEDSSWNSLKNVVTNLPWDGILLTDSPNNTIEDCLTTRAGIELKDGSNDNVVTGCTLGGELSWFAGIGIDSSTRNVLRNNAITENGGLSIDKWSWNGGFPPDESDFVQDIDASNTIDGKPILYLVGQRDLVLDSPDVGYLGIVASNNITINDVTLDHPNTEGLLLVNVQNVTVERCRIEAQGIGIAAFRARDSTVSHCTIDDGSTGTIHSGGIWLVDSAGGIVLSNVTANGISLRGTNGATIRDCDVTSMRIMDSNSNTVTNCAVHGVSNSAKIQLLRSSSNTLAHCLVSDSSWVGLQMSLASNGNTIDQCVLRDNVLGLLVSTNNNLMRNNVFANRLPGIGEIVHLGDTGISPPMGVGQAADGGTGNAWNGNYWTDYYGVDQDGDGRGDTPHRWAAVYQIGVNTKTDDLPWMDPVAGSGPAPVVSFAYAMHGHQALQFTDWSMSPGGTLVSWAWSFGDGSGAGTSQEQNPIYRYASAGTYQVSLTVTDDQGRSATHVTSLTVREGNEPPVIAHPGHKTIAEAAPLAFLIAVSDADRDTVRVSATSLPAGASYDDSARTFSWVPSFDQAGTYAVTFTANDGALDTSISVDITVVNVNRAPVLATVIDRAGREGDAIGFTLSATDPDGDSPAYSGEGLPTGASVNSVSGAFTWTPSYQQAGSYSLRFVATDGTLSDAKTATLVITNVQRAPVLTPIGNKATFEGAALSVSVSASDPENDALTLLASPLPAGASFTDRHDGSGVFSWTPGAHARGDYAVTFRATDGIAEAIETIAIRVAATNGVPSFTPIGNRTVSEADQLNFVVSAIDSNGDTLTYSATNVPRGASFDANRRVFSWQPDFAQAGTHIVAFRVTDGTTSVTENATINVTNVNRAPIVSGATSATVKAARTLNMVAPIVDPDGDALDYVFTGLPEGASSTGGIITWRPTSAQVGNYSVLVHATDGAFATQATLTIAVIENLAPLVSVSAPAAAEVLVLTNFMANASDPDGTSTPAIAWDFDATDGFQAQRTGANVTWAFPATGTFTVTARATDADGMLTTQTFSVSVDDNVALLIEALEQATDGTTNARATVTNWDGSGIANATVTVNVYYEPIAGAGKVLLRTLTVTTGEDGSVLFDIPQDTPLANLKGTHVLEASAVTQTSLGGDQETAEDMDEYTS